MYEDTGQAGDIVINVGRATLANGGVVDSSALLAGAGGNIIITATEDISISGKSAISTFSGTTGLPSTGQGKAGDIVVSARGLNMTRGLIANVGFGEGDGGDIRIDVVDTARLTAGSLIAAGAVQDDGGNIEIKAGRLVYLIDDSDITTQVIGGTGEGGNIIINPEFVVLNGSRIAANAFGGPGGNIQIVASQFFRTPDSVIDASSRQSIDGNVVINSPNNDIAASIARLPVSFLNAAALLSQRCAARAADEPSSFVIRGRGAVPSGPDDWTLSSYGNDGAVTETNAQADANQENATGHIQRADNSLTMLKLGCAR